MAGASPVPKHQPEPNPNARPRSSLAEMEYTALIRNIPDFPQPGIIFRDITPLLGNAQALRAAIQEMAAPFRDKGIDQEEMH